MQKKDGQEKKKNFLKLFPLWMKVKFFFNQNPGDNIFNKEAKAY